MRYRIIAGCAATLMLASFVLGGCGQKKLSAEEIAAMQADFDAFMQKEFVDSMENSWIMSHIYMEHPEYFGVDTSKIKVELAPVPDDAYLEMAKNETQISADGFAAFDRAYLTEEQQSVYDVFSFLLDLSEQSLDDKFKYYSVDFSTLNGSYNQIPTLLADLELRSEKDVQDLVTLVESTDDYLMSSADFLGEQAEAGTLMIDIEAIEDYCTAIIDAGTESSTLRSMIEHIEAVDMKDDLKAEYEAQLTDAYETSYLPAYQYIVDTLDGLDASENIDGGLAQMKEGKAFYELLVKQKTGSSKSVPEIKKMLEAKLEHAYEDLSNAATEDYNAYIAWMNGEYNSGFDDFKDMLDFLFDKMQQDYPAIDVVDYTIDPLASDLENTGVLAYYNLPALDQTGKQRIKVNTGADTLDMESLDTFATVAHEGFPGHMYQNNYAQTLGLPAWLLTVGSCDGFSEGYATYTQLNALSYLDELPESVVAINKAMNEIEYMAVALCDIAIHYEGMDRQALGEYMEELGLSAEAVEALYDNLRANPATFLSYYVGYAEIDALRAKAEKALGDQFEPVAFHEALLKNGCATFDVVEKSIDAYIAGR